MRGSGANDVQRNAAAGGHYDPGLIKRLTEAHKKMVAYWVMAKATTLMTECFKYVEAELAPLHC